MLLKYGLIYYSCAETFTFLIHCVECRRAMLGIFLDRGCSIIPRKKEKWWFPTISKNVQPGPDLPSPIPFLYSMPPDFSCAKHLVYEGGCRVLPWHVQCMLLCQPRIEEEDQMNQWQNENRSRGAEARVLCKVLWPEALHHCEEHVNPEVLEYNRAVSPSHLLQVRPPDPHDPHSTLLPHTLRTPARDPSAPRSPWTRSVLGLLAAAEEVQHPKPRWVKQRMGGNGTFWESPPQGGRGEFTPSCRKLVAWAENVLGHPLSVLSVPKV